MSSFPVGVTYVARHSWLTTSVSDADNPGLGEQPNPLAGNGVAAQTIWLIGAEPSIVADILVWGDISVWGDTVVCRHSGLGQHSRLG